MTRSIRLLGALLAASCLLACDKKEAPPPAAASSATVAIPAASASSQAAPASKGKAVPLALTKGKSTFLIDAPLEKIKGVAEDIKGSIDVNPEDLAKTRGEISFKLSTLKTNTFGDAGKDESQTDHARNWMQVGKESKPEDREKFEWATFKITSVEATPAKLANPQEDNGGVGPTIKGKATGDFTLHGVTSRKTLSFSATFKGPADKPTGFTLKTEAPFDVSLKEHDIKPRDGIGSFLNGALEKIGKKIDDKVQVSLDVTAGS